MFNYYKNFFLIIIITVIFFISFNFISDDLTLSIDLVILKAYLASFFPPYTAKYFLVEVFKNAVITISIASVSVLISAIIAVPIAIYTSNKFSESLLFKRRMNLKSYLIRMFSKINLIFFRSIPELILAIFFVRIFGLGVLSAVLSIVIIYTGLMAKVYIEIIDSEGSNFLEKALYNGSGKFKNFLYVTLSICSKDFLSYMIFRWECAIRTSLVIGIVGAGGLGQQLFFAMQTMELNKVLTIIISLLIIVIFSDFTSKFLRERFLK